MCLPFKNTFWVNTRKGEKLFRQKDNIGIRSSMYKLLMNNFKGDVRRRFLVIRAMKCWNILLSRVGLLDRVRASPGVGSLRL